MLSGTWKQNMAKSKYDPANLAAKSAGTKWAAVGADGLKWVADGVDVQGKPTHSEFNGKFDGKDFPIKGIPIEDTILEQQADPLATHEGMVLSKPTAKETDGK